MKKISLILISIFCSLTIVNADVTTIPRTEDDLGVNKDITITESRKKIILNTPRVDAAEKIYDFANILDENTKQQLYEKAKDYVSHTSMDIVILTLDFTYSDSQIENYAVNFYDYNDFGLDFDNYSGILIVRNANNYNRFFNIYTFGDAQLYYPYERCEEILDNIYEDIRSDRYLEGFSLFINDAKDFYDDGIPSDYDDYYIDDTGHVQRSYSIPWIGVTISAGIVTTIVVIILVKKNKMVKKATEAENYLNRNSINYKKSNDIFLHSRTSSYTVSSSSGGGGGSFGGSRTGSSGRGYGGGGGRHG